MQLKLFFLAFVLGFAACRSAVKHIIVSPDGSYIEITSDLGVKVDIIKNRYELFGVKDFDIVLTGPTFEKDVHLNNQVGGDVIFDLFRRYNGVVDDVIFEKILYKLEHYVQQGEVHPQVFHMILALHDPTYLELFAKHTYGGYYGHQYSGLGLHNYHEPSYYGKYYGQQYHQYAPLVLSHEYTPSVLGHLYSQLGLGHEYVPSVWGHQYPSSVLSRDYPSLIHQYPSSVLSHQYPSVLGHHYPSSVLSHDYPSVWGHHYPSTVLNHGYTPSLWNQISYKNQMPYYHGGVHGVGDDVQGLSGHGLYGAHGYTGGFWNHLQAGNLYNLPSSSYSHLYHGDVPSYHLYSNNQLPVSVY